MKRKQERSAGEYDRQYSLGFGRSVGKHFQRDISKSLQINFGKSLAAALSAALVLSTISWHGASLQAEASSGEKNGITYESYVSGDREKQKEYTTISISTEEELIELAKNCSVDSWSEDKIIRLEADIVLQKKPDLVIPSFGGILEGNGHTISGIYISDRGSDQGLFRYIRKNGKVRSLKVEGKVSPDGTQSEIGGIAGVNYGVIFGCSFSGIVEGDTNVGGIAGENASSGEIRKCDVNASVTGNHSTGGIAGLNEGTINNCVNNGNINVQGTEVSYEVSDLSAKNLEKINSTSNVEAHTDTGGIAGLSSGKIYYSTNTGTIGYQHVGYNVGGVAGRVSQGYLQNCTNTGAVYGRKDVGGIVGQLEPFLEISYLTDNLTKLDEEIDTMIDMLDQLQDTIRGGTKESTQSAKALTANLENISDCSNYLLSTGAELWYLYSQELNGISSDLKTLGDDIGAIKPAEEPKDDQSSGINSDAAQSGAGSVEENSAENNEEGSGTENSAEGNAENSADQTQETSIKDDIQDSLDDLKDQLPDTPDDLPDISDKLPDTTQKDLGAYEAALKKFGTSASKHLENMSGSTMNRTKEMQSKLNTMDQQMKEANKNLDHMVTVLENTSDSADGQFDQITAQSKKIRSLVIQIRDDLFGYEGISISDTSDEKAAEEEFTPGSGTEITGEVTQIDGSDQNSDTARTSESIQSGNGESSTDGQSENEEDSDMLYDTTSFQKGKITRSLNQGKIEADANVGGIVGQIATEYDFDPEDDVTVSGAESFQVEQTMKAVIRESRNTGKVTAKKDYAGGVVGRADYGAVISCESYADVKSTSGSYVGGIAGSSGYAIRSSYSSGRIEGKSYVGGVAGKGCDIFYSYTMAVPQVSEENVGAVAGLVALDGTISGNFYVEGNVGGIDGIGYADGAQPLSYEAFCASDDIPDSFLRLTVTFEAEGEILGTVSCNYGDTISVDSYPKIPEKEGYYALWPEEELTNITFSKVVEAKYSQWVGSIASARTDESGKPQLLAEGNFYPETEITDLTIEDKDFGGVEVTFSIQRKKEEDTQPVTVHYAYSGEDIPTVMVKQGNAYKKVDVKTLGSYLVFSIGGETEGIQDTANADTTGLSADNVIRTFRILPSASSHNWIWIAAIGAGAVIILLGILLLGSGRNPKSPGGSDGRK